MRWAIHILVLATIPWLTLCQQEQEEDDVCTMGMMLLQGISRKLRGSNLVPTEHTKEEIINDVDSIKSSLRTVNDQLSKMNRNLECLKGNTLKWIRLESGKKYYYSDFYKYTWYDAKEFCENSGGVLASTHNEDELKTIYKSPGCLFLQQTLDKIQATFTGLTEVYWTGTAQCGSRTMTLTHMG
ncbi:uncharacterized protein LOC135945975 isoform X2 [Cloeon dipterum]|uniref:uncharacterized protein LOC135945975 isoform X2 n=1 Tax=Cloeon dipterum TaxID=197152 RepID=UPI00321FAF25